MAIVERYVREGVAAGWTWATATAYALNDIVIGTDGNHYYCILAHTSGTTDDQPVSGATWATYWALCNGQSEAFPFSLIQAAADPSPAGKRYNVRKGTYTLGATLSTTAGIGSNPAIYRGYNTTIGDLEAVGRATTTGALNTTDFPVIVGGTLYTVSFANYTKIVNLRCTSAKDAATVVLGVGCNAYRSSFVNTHATGASASAVQGASIYGGLQACDVSCASTHASLKGVNIDRGYVKNSRIWHTGSPASGAHGMYGSFFTHFIGNIVFNWGIGIGGGANVVDISRNTIYNCVTGLYLGGGGGTCSENVIWAVADAITANANFLAIANAIGSFTTSRIPSGNREEVLPITLDVSPFTNAGAEDFTLNNDATGGARCRMAAEAWGLNADVGAVQHADAGGGLLVSSGMNGGFNG